MCGIAGIVRWDGAAPPPGGIERMTRALAHRGPDGEGFCRRGPVALGHRRLSIIDLDTGKQPMFNEDGQVAVTFNGEIYNYRELATELAAAGHLFRTKSDTEVIVHAWEQWGKQCVERFRGMFAFAVVDWRQQVVFLARDQLGIKPLYYSQNGARLAFASELQSLRTLPDFSDALDLQALDQYLFLQYIPAPRTIFQNVAKLAPAHRLLARFDGRVDPPERYWSLHFAPRPGGRLAGWAEELESVLRESVQAHLVADVPFGAFLSGGVDSSIVVGLMAQQMAQPVRTFSIGFDETEYSELPYAQQVADRWRTEHHVAIVRPDAIGILPRLVQHYGEPFGDSSAIPTFYVSQLAREFVPMVLSGDGGDEAFAGYASYQGWRRWLDGPTYHRPLWKRAVRPLVKVVCPRLLAADPAPRQPSLPGWFAQIQYIAPEVRRRLWRAEHRHLVDRPVEAFEQAFRESADLGPVNLAQSLDYRTYLPNDILPKVDVASMMHGLEVRTPIVDVRVAEFAATIPSEFTLSREDAGGWAGKRVLRQILARYFPDSFVNRPKMGFAIPLERWLNPNGQLREIVEERLVRNQSAIHEYFEPAAIRSMVAPSDPDSLLPHPLWLLLFLEEWLRQTRSAGAATRPIASS